MRHPGIVGVVFLVWAGVALAGNGTWTSNGPNSGPVNAVAIDPINPGVVYAGTSLGGASKTTNGGATWAAVVSGLTSPAVNVLAVDPIMPATIYAGTPAGVFKTIDAGAHWTVASSGLTSPSVRALAIDPQNTATVYAGTTVGGIFKSTDGGGTWHEIDTGLTDLNIYSLVIDPVTTTTLYAGTFVSVFKSTDGGSHWNVFNLGMVTTPILAVAVDPTMPTTVYAATYYGGMYKSLNGGANWSGVNNGLTRIPDAIVVDPVTPANLYVGTDGGVFKSSDGGASWVAFNNGLPIAAVAALAMDTATPSTLYAGTASSVYSITSPGTSCLAPLAPTATAADLDACTKSGVQVGWTDPASWGDGNAGTRTFDVLRNGTPIVSGLLSTTHSYTDNGGLPGTSYAYAVRANNGCALSATSNSVNAADLVGAIPTITTQPASQTISSGQSAVLTVLANGATSYQWYQGANGDTSHPIGGQTGTTYTTPALTASASYWVRASNGCGSADSATALVFVSGGSSFVYLVPAAAHLPGLNGTAWRTDVTTVNASSTSANVLVSYVSSSNSMTGSYSASLPPNGTVSWSDILVGVFGLPQTGSNKGTLQLSSNVSLAVFSRNYNQTAAGTFGQSYPALTPSDGITTGQMAVLPGLVGNAAYRTNVGAANLSLSGTCSIEFDLYGPAGTKLGTPVVLAVGPRRFDQVPTNIFDAAGAGSQDLAYATVQVLTPGCSAWAYASLIDNTTGGPTTIAMKVMP